MSDLRAKVNSLLSRYFSCINCNKILEKPLVYDCVDGNHFTCASCETDTCIICDSRAKTQPFPLIEQMCIALRRTRTILDGQKLNLTQNENEAPKPHIKEIFDTSSMEPIIAKRPIDTLQTQKKKNPSISRISSVFDGPTFPNFEHDISTPSKRPSKLSALSKSSRNSLKTPKRSLSKVLVTPKHSSKRKSHTPTNTPNKRPSTSRQASRKASQQIQNQYNINSEADFYNYSLSATGIVYCTTSGCDLQLSESVCVYVDDFNSSTTHLVCKESTENPKRTFKYLLALASNTPIVTEQYIFECIKANEKIPELSFLANGCLKGSPDAPQRSFLSNTKLLEPYSFHLVGTFTKPPTTQIESLIKAANGRLSDSKDSICICDDSTQEGITTEHLFNAISHYDVSHLKVNTN